MLWALSVTQMNGLKDVQEEVHGVMNKLKSDSIFHSIMQIKTEKKAARKTDYFGGKKTVRAFELVPLSWVSRTRRNSKLLLCEAPKYPVQSCSAQKTNSVCRFSRFAPNSPRFLFLQGTTRQKKSTQFCNGIRYFKKSVRKPCENDSTLLSVLALHNMRFKNIHYFILKNAFYQSS